jgi:hypothetical protein
MSEPAVNVLAIAIFVMTLSVLLGPLIHLSALIPALFTLGLLGLVTADQLVWQGKGGNLVLDRFASQEQRQRILHHEAGHFLAAYYLSIPVIDYSLSAWETFQKGKTGLGGVEFALEEIPVSAQDWQRRLLFLERFATVWMAGRAAEQLIYGKAEGGMDDRQRLKMALQLAGLPESSYGSKESWALLQAKNLLMAHRLEYDQLVQAMARRDTVTACYQLLAQSPTPQTD